MSESFRNIEGTSAERVITANEWDGFKDELCTVAESFNDITGAIAIGSFVQLRDSPSDFYENRRPGRLGEAYESIRNPHRRKHEASVSSDLDIWLCLSDNQESRLAQERVDRAGMALLDELASENLKRGDLHWMKKKQAVFGDFYKKPRLYNESFISQNGWLPPWSADSFKKILEKQLQENAPGFVEKINEIFSKKIPGDFLEIRAFPESLFNLRPDDVATNTGIMDREPFPRIADDQWISPDYTSIILYNNGQPEIYPFRTKGCKTLGKRISDYIEFEDREHNQKSYGALLIKPDALQKNQLEIILNKIDSGVNDINGRIVICEKIESLSPEDIESIYPLLRGQDLEDAKAYLTSGPVVIIIVEADIDQNRMFKAINGIKGVRISDRDIDHLLSGRREDGTIRDLIPLPGEENIYRSIVPTIIAKKTDPSIRFSDKQYQYYSRNLIHSPDNRVELDGLLSIKHIDRHTSI